MLATEAVDLWERELRTLRELAPKTAREHVAHVRGALGAIGAHRGTAAGELRVEDLRRDDLVAALDEYRSRTGSVATVRRRMAALRSFYSWCVETERVTTDVARTLRMPRVPAQREADALGEDEARRVLAAAGKREWAERDTLLVALVLTMGLRLREAVALRVRDVRGEVLSLPDREVPLSPAARNALAAYLPTRSARLERHDQASEHLLVSRAPVKGSMDPTVVGMGATLDRVVDAAGVKRRGVRAQTLRATFATLASGSGAYTTPELGAVLGVRSQAALSRYTPVSTAALASAAGRHPLAQ